MPDIESISFAFFGTPKFATIVLDELEAAGLLPELVVTAEDQPRGRGLIVTPPPVKVWADKRNIPTFQPTDLEDFSVEEFLRRAAPEGGFEIFIVASYGKIIPENILNIPKHGGINVHPSLLPKLRGPSPVVGAILSEDRTGVTIMHLDKKMDHGGILSQKEVAVPEWPPYEPELESILAREGGRLLAEVIPKYVAGQLAEIPQDESKTTYTKKITKEDASVNLGDNPQTNLRKIRAYAGSLKAYAFFESDGKKIRVIITRARLEKNALILERVIPEGRKEMDYADFERGFLKQ